MNLRRKALSLLLSAAMILNMGINPVCAIAADGDTSVGASSLCEHHNEHTKECGYTEGAAGTPCTHEHTADCYTGELICGLTEEVQDSSTDSDAAHTHTQECYKLNCAHKHDNTCGYIEGTVGTPCTYECEVCNAVNDKPLDSGAVSTPSNAAKAVTSWQFVDPEAYLTDNTLALPGVSMERQAGFEDIIAMLPTALTGAVEGEADPVTVDITGWACESYQQDENSNWPISGTYTFAAALTEGYSATPAPTVAVELGGANVLVADETGNFTVTGGTYGTSHKYENNTLTIMDSTALTISGTTTADKIVVQSGVTANITLDDLSIDVSGISDACAFDMTGATVNLVLKDATTNALKSSRAKAALLVPAGATLAISGQGTLEAIGNNQAAGIGGGWEVSCGKVTITEGTVIATADDEAAGIGGGGRGGAGGDITISGGTVIATGGINAAGIGGGYQGRAGDITISGGTVIATGGRKAAGIGGGSEGAAGTFSTGASGTAFIVASGIADKNSQSEWNGIIFDGSAGALYGVSTLSMDAEIPSGYTLTIKAGETLTIDSGKTLTIAEGGTLVNNGTLTNNGILANSGTLTNTATYDGTGTLTGAGTVNGIDFKLGSLTIKGAIPDGNYACNETTHTLTILSDKPLTISGTTTADKIVVASGVSANITLDSVSIDVSGTSDTCAFDIPADAILNLTLKDATTNVLASGANKAGLSVPTGATLNISGTGSLVATGGSSSPGIGDGGSITISGGMVIATGSTNAAGIAGTVNITGGTVTTKGSGTGAGINGTTTISGGTVTAEHSSSGTNGIAGTFTTTPTGNAFINTNGIADQSDKANWCGVIFMGDTGLVYGAPILTTDAVIPNGKTLTIDSGKVLTIGKEVTLTNNGAIANSGTINISGALSGTPPTGNAIVNTVTVGDFSVAGGSNTTDYKFENHTLSILTATPLTIYGTTIQDKIVVQSGITANITLVGVEIQLNDGSEYFDGSRAFDIGSGATVNLTLMQGTTSTLKSGERRAGIFVPTGANLNVGGKGTLNAISGSHSAGIGGEYGTSGGGINITEGIITATGGNGFSVFGGTTNPIVPFESGAGLYADTISITGGTVYANAGVPFRHDWSVFDNNAIKGKLTTGSDSEFVLYTHSETMPAFSDYSNSNTWVMRAVDDKEQTVYGSCALAEDLSLGADETLTIGSGATLTVPAGKTLTNAGTITVAAGGKLTNNGTVTNNGTIINNGTIDGTAIGGTAPMEKSATTVTFAIKGTPNTPVTAAEYGQTIVVTATAQKDTTSRTRSAAVDTVDFYLGSSDGGTLGVRDVTNSGSTCTATIEIVLADIRWTPNVTPYTIIAEFGGVAGLQASTSTGSLTINKGSRTIPAPTLASKTGTTVTLAAVTPSTGSGDGTVEYGYAATDNSTGISNWQTGLTFSGLTAGTTYYFFARVTGGTNYADTTSTPGTAVETAPAEQFSLPPGGVYYFDLSDADVKGTVNTAIPDITLHYVPFTYAGTVKAYSLDVSSNGQIGSSAAATPNTHSLFISDYTVSHTVSWNDLHAANFIFGKNYTSGGVGYTLRAPSVGSASGVTPITNEWDSVYAKDNSYIKNWNNFLSFGQDTSAANAEVHAVRGFASAAYWTSNSATISTSSYGWRPVLEVLDAATLTADGLQEVTLNLNSGKLGASTANISVVVKNNTAYTAPSGTGLTAPTKKAFTGWNTAQDGSGTSYALGAEVPFTVKILYAQWALPGETTPSATIDYVNEKLAGLTAGAAYSITPADGSAQTKTADANGMIAIDGGCFGKTLTIVKKGVADTTMDSVAQSLAIPARPAKPTATMEISKEKNSIVIANGRVSYSGCEFSKDDGATWGASAYFSGLTAATEYTIAVRVKAVANTSFASEAKTVKVTTVAADGSTTLKPSEVIANDSQTVFIINNGNKTIGIAVTGDIDKIETTITLPSSGGYDVDIIPELKIKVPAGGTVTTKDCPTITLPNGGIVDVYGNVSATAPETVTIGDTTITPPTGGTITTNPGGTSELPGGSTITTGDGPTITLPDGGTVDKDGNASGGENGKITIGDSTITPPTGGTVTTDKDGKTELPGGSTITNGDTTVTIGGGTTGGSIDKDGNVKLPSGGDITVKDENGNSSTITVPGTGGDVGMKDDGTVTVPGGSTVTPPGGGTITVPEGGGTVSGGGQVDTNITVSAVSVTPTTASVEKGNTQQFRATVTGTNSPAQTVTWTLEGYIGTASSISASGLLTVGSGETAQTITVKATSTFDTTKNDTAAVTVTSTPITTYTITASASTGGSISPSGNVTAVRGENKTFTITASSGYSISSVTVDGANQGAISSYTFSNVQAPHTITAAFSKNSSGGDDGGSTGGGNTDNDDSTTVKPSEPTKDNPTPPTIGIVETPIKPDKNGDAKVEVSDSNIKDAINKAEAQAKKDGKTAGGISVTVNLTSKETVNSVSALLSADTLDRLIKAEVKNFTIQTNLATLRLDLEMLKALKTQAGNSAVEITVGKQDVSQLSKEAQAAIGGRPALSITATYQKDGKTQNITSLGKGRLSVSIPYTKAATEQSGSLYGVYVDGTGKITYITGSSYDENSKALLFGTNHLSIYGVGYKTTPQFTDIANHWAKADIEFVAGRGLLTGTAADKFSPDSSMTRGMFVTALGRLAEIDTSSYKTGQFTDVKADAYYAPYVNWAAKNNIVCGTTATTFAPNQPISRQEMAQMIANYAKAIGFNLPRTHQENIFADSAKIGEWAKVSVKEMQMAGIITGKNGNEFDPAGTATRAEVSAVLRRFVELALDSGTAQGWMQNDSGKWMYYKDGIKLTGKQTISGVSYDFNSNGETKTAPDWSFTTYTVVKGDSFWSIAWDHKVNMFTLASVNGKNIFSIIKAGDVLKIPQG